jgi:hypothetical protein
MKSLDYTEMKAKIIDRLKEKKYCISNLRKWKILKRCFPILQHGT